MHVVKSRTVINSAYGLEDLIAFLVNTQKKCLTCGDKNPSQVTDIIVGNCADIFILGKVHVCTRSSILFLVQIIFEHDVFTFV